ncbi:MAG TPA: Sua5/YciO/YrdC/YwlC family protein [Gaiellales bacterium]|jgi:tRNA threonylcarbamoyl adenosine modification protein (Sua5/YciO/YrdC/YwlC family)
MGDVAVTVPGGAVRLLLDGELALLPTDTVYGIAAAAGCAAACERLYALKSRPASQATAIMLGSVDGLTAALPELGGRALAACRRLLPGAVTVIVENPAHRFAHACGARTDRIGVRVPRLAPAVAGLADDAGGLVITSANLRGGPDPARLADVPGALRRAAAFAVDGGALPGLPSSVIDVTGERPVVLREGPDLGGVLAALGGDA